MQLLFFLKEYGFRSFFVNPYYFLDYNLHFLKNAYNISSNLLPTKINMNIHISELLTPSTFVYMDTFQKLWPFAVFQCFCLGLDGFLIEMSAEVMGTFKKIFKWVLMI